MSLNCCYIDYLKREKIDLDINKNEPAKEIKVSATSANIYFLATKSSLVENDSFVLLLDGLLESFSDLNELLAFIEKVGFKEALKGLDGVFSLTLYDKKAEKFYIARDHFGLTQTYYYKQEEVVLFSNTLKTFKNCSLFDKKIDFNTLGQYLQHGYILEPNTIFLNTYKVRSAHFLEIDLKTKNLQELKYWDIVDFYNLPRVKLSEEEIIKKSEELLKSAIESKIADSKRVGAFLSGGYDSSTIVSLLSLKKDRNLQTYTVGFLDNEVNEAPFAKKIADHLGIEHHEHYFSADDLKELIESFAKVYDEPIADKAALPTMLISSIAKDDVDIIFGGEGGDEIFASSGFLDKYRLLNSLPYSLRYIASMFLKLLPKSTRNEKWSKMLGEKNVENVIKYKDIIQNFDTVKKLIKAPVKERPIAFEDTKLEPSSHYLDKIFPLVIKSYVNNNLLTKMYFATKHYYIKPRVPYLDRKFVEFLAQVDVGIKRKSDVNKYILKKILKKYIPSELIDRPKKGFDVPVGELLKHELRDILDFHINKEKIEKEGIFDVDEVLELKRRFLNSNSYYDEQNIWNILIFELWHEEWFN